MRACGGRFDAGSPQKRPGIHPTSSRTTLRAAWPSTCRCGTAGLRRFAAGVPATERAVRLPNARACAGGGGCRDPRQDLPSIDITQAFQGELAVELARPVPAEGTFTVATTLLSQQDKGAVPVPGCLPPSQPAAVEADKGRATAQFVRREAREAQGRACWFQPRCASQTAQAASSRAWYGRLPPPGGAATARRPPVRGCAHQSAGIMRREARGPQVSGSFLRGLGSGARARKAAGSAALLPEGPPDAVAAFQTLPQQAMLYRLSG